MEKKQHFGKHHTSGRLEIGVGRREVGMEIGDLGCFGGLESRQELMGPSPSVL